MWLRSSMVPFAPSSAFHRGEGLSKVGSNPRVAPTIDTQTQPPRILLVRGTASMEIVDGVPDDSSRLRTSTFPERSGLGSTRRFAAYTHEWRESASHPNGQSSSTSRLRFPKPLRSC